jgi:hypothetical protein
MAQLGESQRLLPEDSLGTTDHLFNRDFCKQDDVHAAPTPIGGQETGCATCLCHNSKTMSA